MLAKNFNNVVNGLLHAEIRRKPVIDVHPGTIWNDIGSNTRFQVDDIEPFAVD